MTGRSMAIVVADDPPGHVCDLGDEAVAIVAQWWRDVVSHDGPGRTTRTGVTVFVCPCGRRYRLTLGEGSVSVVEEAVR